MKENLEDFVRRNRDAFDDKQPSATLWKKIEDGLQFSKGISFWNSVPLWRAAAIIFMVLSGYLLLPEKQLPTQRLAMKEFNDVERFYIQQISEKTQLIEDFHRTEGLNGFTHDFKQLEAMYQVLREEMKNSPSEKVKDALVLNLLVRIDLLNQQLQKLENGGYKEKEEEKVPSKNV
jgi:hypothetical protein